MNYTSGRITRAYSDLSGAFRSMVSECESLLIYEHSVATDTVKEGGKTHCHYICSHRCTRETIKNRIRAGLQFGDKLHGNEDWKTSNWDGNETSIIYMSKGKIDPVYMLSYTKDQTDKLKALWREQKPAEKKIKNEDLSNYYSQLIDGSHKGPHPLYRAIDIPQVLYSPAMLPISYPKFEAVKSYFFNAMFEKYKLLSPAFFRDRKTFVLTYCFQNNINIPPARDAWEST